MKLELADDSKSMTKSQDDLEVPINWVSELERCRGT